MSGIKTEATQVKLIVNGVDGCIVKETGVLAAGAAGVSGLDVATVGQTLGIGQTWQNMTGSRALNTDYTNATGKPIWVTVWSTATGLNGSLTGLVGGVIVYTGNQANVANAVANCSFLVPAGAVYRVNQGGTAPINTWMELR